MDYTISTIAPIILLPFFAFVIGAFIVSRFEKAAVALSTISIVASFFFALRVFCDFFSKFNTDYYIHRTFNWFDLSFPGFNFVVKMGIYLDNMSATLLLMVTGVGALIHIFSTFYMAHDERFGRFFVYLSLFISAMIGLTLSDNLLSIFIFWEIMGFCSYSLIGFYYEKEAAGNASLKAFMTTRVGDVFFLLGIVALWTHVGSVQLTDIYSAIATGKLNGITAIGIPLTTFAGIAIFMGTIGKSAQFPLQVWLPDAMMGPTPCSALIHAATMVAAGVYLSLRMYPVMNDGGLSPFMAYIGAITAFGAATIALIQTDIKAVLAYSTISQLGYMVMGIGVGAYTASFMHLITHAVFKACLFLSAGSVIHSLHDHHTDTHVQEMPRMGGLRKKLPYTYFAMMCCTLAIAGIPFFSGFVSKDRILGEALRMAMHGGAFIPVAILGFSAALLTAFYMFRMMFLTFFGAPRDKELYDHAHHEHLSWNQNVPLLLLSIFTLGLFYSGSFTGQGEVKLFTDKYEWFETLIQKPNLSSFPSRTSVGFGMTDEALKVEVTPSHYDPKHGMSEEDYHHAHTAHLFGAIMSVIIAFSGVFLAYLIYIRKSVSSTWWLTKFSLWNGLLKEKYHFDTFYIKVLIGKMLLPFNNLLALFDMSIFDRYAVDGWEWVTTQFYKMARWFDNLVIDTVMVDGSGVSVKFFNVIMRTVQSGKIQFYFVVAIVVLAGYVWSITAG